jgi:predicted amidohydrolase YtcJ
VGYDERAAGIPDAALLDDWVPDRPLRLADRTGALRVLNTPALALLAGLDLPPGAERNAEGLPTGRFWREDQWLAAALPTAVPDISGLGARLAGLGLTGLTDAGAHNGPAEAALLAGALPQRLVLMGSEALGMGEGYVLGPLKLLIDERDPPEPLDLAARITGARAVGRGVAAHCVTDAELVLFLAALDLAGGARPGDRIEHGGMILAGLIEPIAAAGLTVVTNPTFLHDRGDRYRTTMATGQWDDLYRAASLSRAGIALLGGSDAPYAGVDPWLGMRSARDRQTSSGFILGRAERLDAAAALRLYCRGSIEAGVRADLILCEGSLADVLDDLSPERLRLTMIGGEIAFVR